jgi:ATP-dependent DNA helicase RecQ
VRKIKSLLADKEGKEAVAAEESLAAMVRYADSDGCRRAALLSHFGEAYPKPGCGSCDVCLGTTDASLKQDVTTQAYKLLSCVKRTGERYGAGHVVDVLIGSHNDRVVELGHDNLSTWGIGKEWEKGLWLDLARQLVRTGYLDRSPEWQVLSLTRKAVDAMREREPIEAAVAPEKSGGHHGRKSAPSAKDAGPAAPEDPALGKALRDLRKRLAAEGGIPPFMVFSDRTLRDLMAKRPASGTELLRVYGMGELKVEHYGARILEALRDSGGPS